MERLGILREIGVDKIILRKLAKLDSNSAAAKGYREAVANLAQADDPARLGKRKHGPLRHLHSCRITRSPRLLYPIDRRRNAIVLVDLDDHKNAYGKD